MCEDELEDGKHRHVTSCNSAAVCTVFYLSSIASLNGSAFSIDFSRVCLHTFF